jgi:TetR/AcrR family transcriptional regulator of autoinduction and epiphytic fitness
MGEVQTESGAPTRSGGAGELDPRVERSRRVILRAALAELGAVGYGAFTIESVAARAGVGKSTIYRHWPGAPGTPAKLALIADAFRTLNVQPAPPEAGGAPRERIARLLRHLAEGAGARGSPFGACVPALVDAAERDPAVRRFHHAYNAQRRQRLIDAIAAGIEAGDLPARLDPELAALALLGPIFYRRLMTGEPFEPARVAALIDTVLGPGPS